MSCVAASHTRWVITFCSLTAEGADDLAVVVVYELVLAEEVEVSFISIG